MRRIIVGGFVMAGLLSSALLTGAQRAEASKPFTPVTKLACAKCHTSKAEKDMTDKDLNECGKAAQAELKKGDYKATKDAKEQKAWAEKLLKGFKCPK